MTPTSSWAGIWEGSGGGEVKTKELVPIGMGPTMQESSSWSLSGEVEEPT